MKRSRRSPGETGVNENVLHRWKQKMVVSDRGEPDNEKLVMRKRIMELEMDVEILKKAAIIFSRPGVARFGFIEKEKASYPMRIMFLCMKVSRTAYYAWVSRQAKPEEYAHEQAWIRTAVTDKFYFHKSRYGSRRVSGELKEEGVRAGRFVVSRVMPEEGLVAKGPKRFKPRTTDSRHIKTASPNLPKDAQNTGFTAGEVLVGDITYLPVRAAVSVIWRCFRTCGQSGSRAGASTLG